jgi:hypothetical protein
MQEGFGGQGSLLSVSLAHTTKMIIKKMEENQLIRE